MRFRPYWRSSLLVVLALAAVASMLFAGVTAGPAFFRGVPESPQSGAVASSRAMIDPLRASASSTGWTQLPLTHSPSCREPNGPVWDAADGYLLMFGGYAGGGSVGSCNGAVLNNQTWKFQDGGWVNITSTVGPSPPPISGAMTYDAADGYVVLFGGTSGPPWGTSSYYENYTWIFSGGKWTNLSSTIGAAPPPEATSIAYDSHDGYVVLFGGARVDRSTLTMFNNNYTWKFKAGHWTNITASVGPSPPPRGGEALVDDPADGYLLLYGGMGCPSSGCYEVTAPTFEDTWSFQGGTWKNLTSPGMESPGDNALSEAAYDPLISQVLLFGGCSSLDWWSNPDACSNETWRYAGGVWAQVPPGPNNPIARGGGGMAFDPDVPEDAPVLFGGEFPQSTSVFPFINDTWNFTFSGSTFAASGSVNTTQGVAPMTVQFNATVYGGTPGYSWSWSFGDGGTSHARNPVHTYNATGAYVAVLVVTDARGAQAQAHVGLNATVPILSAVSISPSGANLTFGGSIVLRATNTCVGGPCPWVTSDSWYITNAYVSQNSTMGTSVQITAGNSPGTSYVQIWASLNGVTVMSANVPINVTSGPPTPVLISFSVHPPTCSLTFNGTLQGSGSSGSYLPGSYSASASQCPGYTFAQWNATGGVAVRFPTFSSSPVSVSAAGTLTADYVWRVGWPWRVVINFTESPPRCPITFNGSSEPNGTSAVFWSGVYTALAPACPGYVFQNWAFRVGSLPGTGLPGPLTVNWSANGSITAWYKAGPTPGYTLTFLVNHAGCSPIEFNGTSQANGSSAQFASGLYEAFAPACAGFAFNSWAWQPASGPNHLYGTPWANVTVDANGTLSASYSPVPPATPLLVASNFTAPEPSLPDGTAAFLGANVSNEGGAGATALGVTARFYIETVSGGGAYSIGGSPSTVHWYGWVGGVENSSSEVSSTIRIGSGSTYLARVDWTPTGNLSGPMQLCVNATASNEPPQDYVTDANVECTTVSFIPPPAPLVAFANATITGYPSECGTGGAAMEVHLNATARGGTPPYQFLWEADNGQSGTGSSDVTLGYPAVADFNATLYVHDNAGINVSKVVPVTPPFPRDFGCPSSPTQGSSLLGLSEAESVALLGALAAVVALVAVVILVRRRRKKEGPPAAPPAGPGEPEPTST